LSQFVVTELPKELQQVAFAILDWTLTLDLLEETAIVGWGSFGHHYYYHDPIMGLDWTARIFITYYFFGSPHADDK
jgi:hypothetical protein